MSILDRNIIAGFQDARDEGLYLRFRGHFASARSEALVWEFQPVRRLLDFALPPAAEAYGTKADAGIHGFIEERFFRQYVPNN